MAESGGGDSSNGPHWPGPVHIDRDEMKSLRITLTIKELVAVKPYFVVGPAEAKNVTTKPDITPGEIVLSFDVELKDGKTKVYEYRKKLPAEIDPEKTKETIKYKKNGLVSITLWKAKEASWAHHASYLAKRNVVQE